MMEGKKRGYCDMVTSNDRKSDPSLGPVRKKSKSQFGSSQQRKQAQPNVDLTYGQRGVFPGPETEISADVDVEVEDMSEAMAYFMSVRQQASSIPHVMIATNRTASRSARIGPATPPALKASSPSLDMNLDDNSDDDEGCNIVDQADLSAMGTNAAMPGGFYEDGAFTAYPCQADSSSSLRQDEDDDADGASNGKLKPPLSLNHASTTTSVTELQNAYYASLMKSFTRLRTLLHKAPPADVVAALPKPHRVAVGALSTRTFARWMRHLREADPLAAQLARFSRIEVLRLLRVLFSRDFLGRRDGIISDRTSRWVWALLARLPDRGELDYEEIGQVRELGKKAVLLMRTAEEVAALVEVSGSSRLIGPGADSENDSNVDGSGVVAYTNDGEGEGEGIGENGVDFEVDVGEMPSSFCDEELEYTMAKEAPSVDARDHNDDDNDNDNDNDNNNNNVVDDDQSLEDGEIFEEPPHVEATGESLEVKAQSSLSASDSAAAQVKQVQTLCDEADRARMNTRATITMILTVAGEFYGQRDLLEFRDPFAGEPQRS